MFSKWVFLSCVYGTAMDERAVDEMGRTCFVIGMIVS